MMPLASHWDACFKECSMCVSVCVRPPHEMTKYHTNLIRSEKCSVHSRMKLLLLYQESICGHLEILLIRWGKFPPCSGPDHRSDRQLGSLRNGTIWWRACRPSRGGLMPCRLSRRCWTTPLIRMATVPPANISCFPVTWILQPWSRGKKERI